MSDSSKPRLGQLLRDKGLISEVELERALQVHNETGRPLGEVLTEELGLVRLTTLREVLAVQQRWRPLGAMLVERGVLSQSQLEQALAEQQRTGRRLGEIARDTFYVSSTRLDELLREQYELELEVERGYLSGLRGALHGRQGGNGSRRDVPARPTPRPASDGLRLAERMHGGGSDPHMDLAMKTVEANTKKMDELNELVIKQREELAHVRDALVERDLEIVELEVKVAELERRLAAAAGA